MKKWIALVLVMLLAIVPMALAEGLDIEEEPVLPEEDAVYSEAADNAIEEEDFMLFSDEPVEKGYADFLTEGEANDGDIPIDEAHFPDEVFRDYIRENLDQDYNDILDETERLAVKSLQVGGIFLDPPASLEGIEFFPNLKELYCDFDYLTSLDLSKNTKLKKLRCDINRLESLDLSKNTKLEWLKCDENRLTNLDLSNNPALTELSCNENKLTDLNLSKNPNLEIVFCGTNQLTSIKFAKNMALRELYCYENKLTSLGLRNLSKLESLSCDVNQLTSLDVSKNTKLEVLICNINQLTSLDISKNIKLGQLDCSNNKLTRLDVRKNTALHNIACGNNPLEKLNLTKNTMLEYLSCDDNQLTSLDLSSNTALTYLYCQGNRLTSLDLTNLKISHLKIYGNKIASLDLSSSQGTLRKALLKTPKFKTHTNYLSLEGNAYPPYLLHFDDHTTLVVDGKTVYQGKRTSLKKAKCSITVKDQEYTGNVLKPIPVVKYKGKALTKGTDYSVKYSNNTKVGLATVTIKGKGIYVGTVQTTFKIKPQGTTLTKLTGGSKKITVKWNKQTKQVSGYQIQFATKDDFSDAVKKTVKGEETAKVTIKALEADMNYYVRIRTYKTVSGKKYYSSWSKSKKVKTK